MFMDIWASVGEFISENYAIGLVIGLILLVIFEMAQYILNSSMEAEIEELEDRVEALEKACGIEYYHDDKERREAVFKVSEEAEKEGE